MEDGSRQHELLVQFSCSSMKHSAQTGMFFIAATSQWTSSALLQSTLARSVHCAGQGHVALWSKFSGQHEPTCPRKRCMGGAAVKRPTAQDHVVASKARLSLEELVRSLQVLGNNVEPVCSAGPNAVGV
eukprot:s1817_g6.t1